MSHKHIRIDRSSGQFAVGQPTGRPPSKPTPAPVVPRNTGQQISTPRVPGKGK